MKKRFFKLKNRRASSPLGQQVHPIELLRKKISSSTHRAEAVSISEIVPYDENLLERSRTQWQFGDWENLAKLGYDTLQHHPDRGKLALLAAAGHIQLEDTENAKRFMGLAQDWGCEKELIFRVFVAGVHNSLGRIAAIIGDETIAFGHFTAAVSLGTPNSAINLLGYARANGELSKLALQPPVLQKNNR